MTATKRAALRLLALGLIAGFLSWWAITRWQQGRRPRAPQPLLGLDVTAVTKISLTNPNGRFRLERTDGGSWRITEPEQTAADPSTVEELLAALQAARISGRLRAATELNLYGLSPPHLVITLETAQQQRWHLEAGKKNSYSGQLYVRTGSEPGPVWLTDGSLRYQLSRDLLQLREKRLLVANPESITGIAVRRPDGSGFAIARRDDIFWLTEPPWGRVDPRSAMDLLTAVGNLKARRFLAPAPSHEERHTYGLTTSLATQVTVQFVSPRSPAVILLALGNGSDVNYATLLADAPIIELASSFIFSQIKAPADQLLDRRILFFERDQVATLIVRKPPTVLFSLHRRRERGRWRWDLRRADGSIARAKASEVFALQYQLWSLRRDRRIGEQWDQAQLAARGLGPGGTGIVLQNAAGDSVAELRLGDHEGTGRLVTAAGTGTVDWVEADKLAAVVFAESHYLAAE